MLLDGILEHNRGFVRGREARPLPAPETLPLAVIACYDPRLDELLPAALGIAPEKTFFLRAAGTVVRSEGDPLRSLALAVYMFGVTEILVVGHTSCRMANFSNAPFIETFRARGVSRDAFGVEDLREWVGAIPDPKRGVAASVAAIVAAPFLPRDLTVAGLVLDDTTGTLEVVVGPGSVRVGPSMPVAAAPPEPTVAASAPPLPQAPAVAPERPAAVETQAELSREIDAIRTFVSSLETTAPWREELARLRSEMERQKSPLVRLALIEKFLRGSAVNARGVAAAFDRLKKETASAGRSLDTDRLVDLFRRTGRGKGP